MTSSAMHQDRVDLVDRSVPPFVLLNYRPNSQIAELLKSILTNSAPSYIKTIAKEEKKSSKTRTSGKVSKKPSKKRTSGKANKKSSAEENKPVLLTRSLAEFKCADYKITIRNSAGITLSCFKEAHDEQGKFIKIPIADYTLSRDGSVTGMKLAGQDWVDSKDINFDHARELLEQCTPQNKVA